VLAVGGVLLEFPDELAVCESAYAIAIARTKINA
jgi:hypothetical protein